MLTISSISPPRRERSGENLRPLAEKWRYSASSRFSFCLGPVVNMRAFGAMIEMSVRAMVAMIYVLDIDPRIARHRLRDGRLHSGG
jgi:hypothetical protein